MKLKRHWHCALFFAVLIAVALWLAGCGKAEWENSSPQSSLTELQARVAAEFIANMVGGEVAAIAPTGSMRPFLAENAYVIYEKCPLTALAVGDIIIYKSEGGTQRIHAIAEKHGMKFWTKGYHNAGMDDEWVRVENFIGRYEGEVIFAKDEKAEP